MLVSNVEVPVQEASLWTLSRLTYQEDVIVV